MPNSVNLGFSDRGAREPKPDGTHACAAAAGRQVNYDACTSITSVPPRNAVYCVSCSCTWRMCRVCVVQFVRDKSTRVVDVKTGLCQFHTDNGEQAERGRAQVFAGTRGARNVSTEAIRGRHPSPPLRVVSMPERQVPSVPPPKSSVPPHQVPRPKVAAAPVKPPAPKPGIVPSPAKVLEHTSAVLGRAVKVPIGRVRRFEGQPRTEFVDEDLKWLAGSIKTVGQLVPVLMRELYEDLDHDYEIVDGERRWRSCEIAGVPEILGIVFDGLNIEDAKKQYAISCVANFGRSSHTPLELAHAIKKLREDNGWSVEQVAAALCMHEKVIYYHLRLLKLCPEVQARMLTGVPEPKRLTIGTALLLIDYPPDFQKEIAGEIAERELNQHRANYLVRQRASERGVKRTGNARARVPADDVQNVMQALGRFDARLSQYLELPEMSLEMIFKRQSSMRRDAACSLLDQMKQKIERMKESIRPSQLPTTRTGTG